VGRKGACADGDPGHDSFADTPWINKLVDFTKRVLAQDRVRTIGVCFGHQIVGRAMEVKVGRNDGGWEVAVTDVQLTEKGKEIFGVEKLVGPVDTCEVIAADDGAGSSSDAPRRGALLSGRSRTVGLFASLQSPRHVRSSATLDCTRPSRIRPRNRDRDHLS
jgi:GMP synthase-like glutamine amidotransferase